MSYLEERIIYVVVVRVAIFLWKVCKMFMTVGVAFMIAFAVAMLIEFGITTYL